MATSRPGSGFEPRRRAAPTAVSLQSSAVPAGRQGPPQPPRGEDPSAGQPTSSLLGIRVLVVEDEMMVAMFIEDTLRELGCEVIEPAHTLAEALARAGENELDAAVLDINIAEKEVYPVAELLIRRGVPFVFATGYALESIPEQWRGRPIVRKPYHARQLHAALEHALRQADR